MEIIDILVGFAAIGSFLAAVVALPVSRRHAVFFILVAVAALTVLFSLTGTALSSGWLQVRSRWPDVLLMFSLLFVSGLWLHWASRVMLLLLIIACAICLVSAIAIVSGHGGQELSTLETLVTHFMARIRPLLMRLIAARFELVVGLLGLAGGIFCDHMLLRLDRPSNVPGRCG